MKQYKQHKLYLFRHTLCLLAVVAAASAGRRVWQATAKPASATATANARWQTAYAKLPLSFELNRGQARQPIQFLARGDGYNLALLPDKAVLTLSQATTKATVATSDDKAAAQSVSATVQIKLAGANQQARVSGGAPLPGKSNYFLGADPQKWQTDVPTYAQVKYENVYPGVDAIFYGNQRQLEYDFIVAPGADPQAIRLDFAGAQAVRLDEKGELVLATAAGEIRQHRPIVYQEINGTRQTVAGSYQLTGQQASFELGAYDHNLPLVIDPVVSYATLLGENASLDIARAIAVDARGDVYITGQSRSTSFPVTFYGVPNDGQPTAPDASFTFVTKMNGTGTAVIYSALIGGTKGTVGGSGEAVSNSGAGLAVDAQGNAYIGGTTRSHNFPVTPGAYKTTYTPNGRGLTEAFVVKLNAVGNALVFATLVGGSGEELVKGLALDAAGNAAIVGNTTSVDFPVTNAATGKVGDSQAAFVARISANGASLLHANVLDSAGQEEGRAIAADAAGNVYITGITYDGFVGGSINTPRFPRTQGTFQHPFSPQATPDRGWGLQIGAYVAKFSASGQLSYSSVLGDGQPKAIAVDHQGNVCIVGWSQFIRTSGTFGRPDFQSFDVFPRTDSTTVQQDSPTFGPQTGGLMLLKLNPAGTELLISHRFGYPSDEAANGVAIDAQGFIHVTGYTMFGFISPDGPVELENLLRLYPYEIGRHHAFHLKFTPDGKTVAEVDFLRSAQGTGVAIDPAYNVYLLGLAGAGFRTTTGAYQTQLPHETEPRIYFVAKLGTGANPNATPTPGPSATPTPTPTPAFHAVSGRVTDYTGKPMGGVTITLTGAAASVARTDGNGYYVFRNLRDEGVYRVTPAQRGPTINFKTYYPNPGWQEVDGLERDLTVNFSYALTSPWVPPNATPTPTPTPVSTPRPTPTPAQDSLLINPNFDQAGLGWSTSGQVLFTNGLAKLLPTTSLSPASVSQTVQVTPGATYAVTADVTANTTARASLNVSFENGGSGGAQTFNNVLQPRTIRVVFTVPAGANRARIYVQTNGSFAASSAATVDNFTLTRLN